MKPQLTDDQWKRVDWLVVNVRHEQNAIDKVRLEAKVEAMQSTLISIVERAEMAIEEIDEYGWKVGLTAVRQKAADTLQQVKGDT